MTMLGWFRWLFFPVVLGCLPAACWTQTRSGQVVDSVTGQPIARALVQAGEYETLTDREGRFSFETAQQIAATATRPGYFLDPFQSPADNGSWLLRLTPEAILYGTVTDTNLQPMQHLDIQLRRLQVSAGLVHWQQVQSTVTNAEGEFRFAELPAGKYSLTTAFMVDGMPDAPSSLAFAPTLYPPAGSEEAGEAITLAAGGHVEANVNLVAEKLYPVSGVIHGLVTQGAGLSVATLEGLAMNVGPQLFADTGIFRFRVPRGAYRLKVQQWGENPSVSPQSGGTREIAVGAAGLEGVSITLAPLPNVPVEVEYQPSATKRQESLAPFYFNLSLHGDDAADGLAMIQAQPLDPGLGRREVKPGDPLLFHSVPPAHYVLQAQISPPWYVASASCGNLDLTRELLVVGNGTGACSMQVGLRDDSATLHWSVANAGRPVTVMAFPLANLTQEVGGANTSIDSTGDRIAATMSGLAPGRYLVIAARNNLDVPYRDPEALKKYATWGKEVALTANGDTEVELEMAPEEP